VGVGVLLGQAMSPAAAITGSSAEWAGRTGVTATRARLPMATAQISMTLRTPDEPGHRGAWKVPARSFLSIRPQPSHVPTVFLLVDPR
jgi:hypothetical protein